MPKESTRTLSLRIKLEWKRTPASLRLMLNEVVEELEAKAIVVTLIDMNSNFKGGTNNGGRSVKHGVKLIRTLLRRDKFALKILKSFAPVIV